MTKEVIFFQGEEILNKLDERRVFGQELTSTKSKYIFSILFQKKPKEDELNKIRSILSANELNFEPNIVHETYYSKRLNLLGLMNLA